MAIINQDLGTSEQRQLFDFTFGAMATGATVYVGMIPYVCNLDFIQAAAYGVSGSPVGAFWVDRFIPGTGSTTYILGSSLALGERGVSGVLSVSTGVSLPTMGSSLNILLPNDIISYRSGGTNSAVIAMIGGLCLRPLNSHIKWFGVF